MTAEQAIARGLERQLGSVPFGRRLRLMLDQPITNPTTHRLMPGPHIAGWIEKLAPDRVRIRLVPTEGGRVARALLEEDLLDPVVERDSVRLVDLGGDDADVRLQHERSQELLAWATRRRLRRWTA